MKKIILIGLCAVLAAALLSGCVSVSFSSLSGNVVTGRGTPETYSVSVGRVTGIKADLYCDIEYFAAESDTVSLEIQPNLREYIVVEESGGILTIRATRNINITGKAPVLTVSTTTLNSIDVDGAGVFTAHDTIVSESFSLSVDGAFAGKADLDVGKLSVSVSGAGNFELSGNADIADIELDGASTLDALSLNTRSAAVTLEGVGTVKLSCSEALRIKAGGLGTIEYKGSPSVDIERDGMVTVKNVG